MRLSRFLTVLRETDLTEAQHQWDTPQFRSWFGKSRAKDDLGRPVVYYHGSAMNFDQFDLDRAGTGSGHPDETAIFLSSNPAHASTFAEIQGASYDDDHPDARPVHHQGAVYPCYVRLERPYKSKMTHYNTNRMIAEIKQAKAASCDGITFHRFSTISGHEHGAICVFSPDQIKSATGNSGAFSRDSSALSEAVRSITIAPNWRDPFRMLLLVNPSRVELDRIVGGASQQEVRVMLCEGRLYAWDANLCAHNEVIQALNLNSELLDGRVRRVVGILEDQERSQCESR